MNYKDKINKYKVISFDIFDTLITRNLENPKSVFDIVDKQLKNKNIIIEKYKETRIEAERIAREKSNKEEITLDEIYENFQVINKITPSEIDIIKKTEEEIEIAICEKNKNGFTIYEEAIKQNKEIVIISDMYLPKLVIEKILSKNNIKYTKLYLSSELQLTKSKGSIFKFVLKDLNINSNEIMHFGDNRKSDFINPKKIGIEAEQIKNNINQLKNNNFTENIMQNFILNNIDISQEYFWKLGYKILGPLLFTYAKWLNCNFEKNKYDKVFFLSRDGLIMQKAFNIINPLINTEYLYASRRALIVPTLWLNPELDDIVNIMFLSKDMTLKAFIKKLGLEPDKYTKVVEENDYNLNQHINIFQEIKNQKFLKFYNEIKADIKENSQKEHENLLKYISNKKFEGKVAIVDIGWFGNMQKAFQKIIDLNKLECNLTGYYIGIVPESDNQNKYSMNGFLFEKNKNEDLFYKKKFFNAIFEMFFSANHGSVKRYLENDVEFSKYEYENTKTQNDIIMLQNGALEFVKQFNNSEISKYIEIDEYTAMQNFLEFGNNPTQEDINQFKNVKFYDDDFIEVIPSKTTLYYLCHIKEFIIDFKRSIWKTGFLKNIFKININYYNLIMKIRKIFIK